MEWKLSKITRNDRMAELGMPNFGLQLYRLVARTTAVQALLWFNSGTQARKKWNAITDFIASDRDLIQPLIDEDSSAYAD